MADKTFTRQEVALRSSRRDAALIIDNVVYGVSEFLEEHPGGAEILLDNAGKDATECFRDVGHSADARLLMEQFVIGQLVEEDRWEYRTREHTVEGEKSESSLWGLVNIFIPPLFVAFMLMLLWQAFAAVLPSAE